MKQCTKCKKFKTLPEFNIDKRLKSGFGSRCKECGRNHVNLYLAARKNPEFKRKHADIELARRNKNKAKALFEFAKRRAVEKNIPFNLEQDDIIVPDVCPVLGIKMQFGRKNEWEASPTLDRIIPELGYVKGNVKVISWKANRIKTNASAKELELVLDYVKNNEYIYT